MTADQEAVKCGRVNAWGRVCAHARGAHRTSPHPLMGGATVCNECGRWRGSLAASNQDGGDAVHEFEESTNA